jgi:hypothetical protein
MAPALQHISSQKENEKGRGQEKEKPLAKNIFERLAREYIAGSHLFLIVMADHSAACSSWSELPWDLLDCILQHLELPEALAVASVCARWRSAAAASTTSRTSIAGSLGTAFCLNATNASFLGHFLKTAVNVALVLGDLESAGNIPH